MPKSSRPGPFGQRGGTVTVIEQPVLRSYMRKAKFAFYVLWAAVGLLTATILAGPWQHRFGPAGGGILAFLAGGVTGLIIAAIIASIVAAWPVIRVIWWWLPELSLSGGLITGWIELSSHTDLAARLTAVAVFAGVPAAVSPVRRRLDALAWCQISRHRIRTCFNEFIITNRDGSLPLILGARPTPAGTRLWIFLRPGLSLADIQDRADKIAAACWASTVIADQASGSNSALVRIDIKRRDPLTGTIASPLKTVIGDHIPGRKPAPAPVPAALDLTDVTAADVTTPAKTGTATGNVKRPQWPNLPARNDAAASAGKTDGEELSDWI
jgi:hypothetical protein